MTTNLPAILEPLTPADCDCRGLPYMPLEAARLLDSDLVALSTGDEFKAALILWCKSWSQTPASSLPDDDRILAKWAGVSIGEWKTLKEMALRGWLRCSDGRLYHPVIADLALTAYGKRQGQAKRAQGRWDAERARKAAIAVPDQSGGNAMASGPDAMAVQDKVKGKDKGEEDKDTPPVGGEGAAAAPPLDEDDDDCLGPPSKAQASPTLAKGDPPPKQPTYRQVMESWNAMAERAGLKAIITMNDGRKNNIRLRLKSGGLPIWEQALAKIEASKFLCGASDRGWRADFDFVVKAGNFQRILEGVHDDDNRRPNGPGPGDGVGPGGAPGTGPGGRPSQREERVGGMQRGLMAAVERKRQGR